jgi:hypothetical protein
VSSLALASGLLVVAASVARAQIPTYEKKGPGYTLLGSSMVAVDDVDGDGAADLLVGEPYYLDTTTNKLGRAHVYSGRTGALIRTHDALTANQDGFGFAVGKAGDLDGDGVGDYLVGGPTSGGNAGCFAVFSGASGALLWKVVNSNSNQGLGGAVTGLGDVTGDGRPDVLVSRIGVDKIDVYDSGGTHVYTLRGQGGGSEFGVALCSMGDLDGDGADDFAVGEPLFDQGGPKPVFEIGRVCVYSGATGSLLNQSLGAAHLDWYGYSLSRIDDLDGDGIADFLAGAPNAGPNGEGEVIAASGATGKQIRVNVGDTFADEFGHSVAVVGDVNLDGVGDYMVGSPGVDFPLGALTGRADLFSGATGSHLRAFDFSDFRDYDYGWSVAGGDFDGDGIADWAIADPAFWDRVTGDRGAFYVFAGCPALSSHYGAGWPGTNGVPTIDATRPAALGATAEVTIGNSSNVATFALLLLGSSAANVPTSLGGTLLVTPFLTIPLALPAGSLAVQGDIPNDQSLAFLELFLQALEIDAGASRGVSFTEGLKLTIGFDLR